MARATLLESFRRALASAGSRGHANHRPPSLLAAFQPPPIDCIRCLCCSLRLLYRKLRSCSRPLSTAAVVLLLLVCLWAEELLDGGHCVLCSAGSFASPPAAAAAVRSAFCFCPVTVAYPLQQGSSPGFRALGPKLQSSQSTQKPLPILPVPFHHHFPHPQSTTSIRQPASPATARIIDPGPAHKLLFWLAIYLSCPLPHAVFRCPSRLGPSSPFVNPASRPCRSKAKRSGLVARPLLSQSSARVSFAALLFISSSNLALRCSLVPTHLISESLAPRAATACDRKKTRHTICCW